jgi:hypothetical protein
VYFTTHLLAGAALGKTASGLGAPVWAGFLLGLTSHAVLDVVPHHDYRRARYALLDVAAGVAFALALFHGPFARAEWWGGVGGVLPDLEVAVGHVVLSLGRPWRDWFPSHSGLLPHAQCPLPQGLFFQALFAGLGLCLLAGWP